MQTFLPVPSFTESAIMLDNKRLGKQRVEAYQILRTLLGKSKGWKAHPAVQMWKGYERALTLYGIAMCAEWESRGFSDTVEEKIGCLILEKWGCTPPTPKSPSWIGDERLHTSHRSNLLRKDPQYYGQFGWKEKPDLPYFWPTKEGH
jgi:hypothetical protein